VGEARGGKGMQEIGPVLGRFWGGLGKYREVVGRLDP